MVSNICFKKVVLPWASMCHLVWPLSCLYCHDLQSERDSMLACPYSLQGEFKPISNFYENNGPYFLWNNLQWCCMLLPLIGKRKNVSVNSVRQLEQSAPAAAPEESDEFIKLLTGDVGLSGEDCVLEFVWHHCEFIVRCPVDSDSVVRCRAQLLPYGRSVGSCGGWKESSVSGFQKIWTCNHFKTTLSIILTNCCPT